jgi:hypothetical protein
MLEESRRRLARVVERGGVAQVRDFYTRALREIESKLGRVGSTSEKFTAHQLRLFKAQILTGQAQLAKGLRSHVQEVGRGARVDALRGLIGSIKKLEARYTGAEVVLPIEEASRFEGVLGKRESVLRMRLDQGAATHMVSTVQKAEDALAMSLVTGETLGEATERVMGAMENQWWEAERVVRSETMTAFSATQADGVKAAAEELPDIMLRWCEYIDDAGNPLDDRVDDDSRVLHGQLAPPGGVFVWPDDFADVVGGDPKRVKRLERFRGWTGLPVLRPNGRETLSAWRPHWGVPAWQWVDGRRVDL